MKLYVLNDFFNFIFLLGQDNAIKIWNRRNGICLHIIEGHRDWVYSLHLYRELIISSSRDGVINIWNLTNGDLVNSLKGHGSHPVRSTAQYNGKLYSCGDDKNIVQWDLVTMKPLKSIPAHMSSICSVVINESDGKLYSGGMDSVVKVWDVGIYIKLIKNLIFL